MKDGFVTMMRKKWTLLEQGLFLKKTGELLERGYSFSEAVESLLYQIPLKRHSEMKICLEGLKAGHPLYSVLAELKFQKDIIGYIYFADKHGGMLEAIAEASKMILKKHLHFQKLQKAFFYPTLLFMMTILLFVFVEKTLLPQYFTLYDSMGLEVNLFTKLVASLGKMLPKFLILLFLFIIILILGYFTYFSKLPILVQRKYLLKIPFLGATLRLLQTQYLSLQLGYLLTGGLSVYEALQLFENAPKNVFYREIGLYITEKLKRGEDFPNILMQLSLFEYELPFVFKHGQSNGKLDQELLFFSNNCLKKLEEKMEKLLKLIQPILYGIIGILVISMYLSIMLPMFRMLDGI
ncbi:competence type IV pilus assembly protein ComGB [Bacillus sp. CGMCC 1.16607]|uniref:competence type IV pilus assembly protein ComGB n=1 Tax=Bacillus sp. CGMCC 1.16607 TaxID=3351842 RepID=UPI00362EB8EB